MADSAIPGSDASAPRMALGRLGVWAQALDYVPLTQAQALACELEDLGYSAVWLPEVAGRDPLVHAGLLLSATERLVVGTGITNIWGRDALEMSCGHRTLTEAFPERFLLGLGVSHQHLVEGLRGHIYAKPLTAMAAYLDRMDASPFTAQRPTTSPRRVLGALRPKMLRLAADRTDGAHPYFVPPEHTALARAELGDGPLLCPEQALLLETDPIHAREIARKHTKVYAGLPNYANNLRQFGFGDADFVDGGSDRLVDAIVAWGDIDVLTQRVKAHFDAGADHVCVQMLAPGGRDVPIESWRELAPALMEVAGAVVG